MPRERFGAAPPVRKASPQSRESLRFPVWSLHLLESMIPLPPSRPRQFPHDAERPIAPPPASQTRRFVPALWSRATMRAPSSRCSAGTTGKVMARMAAGRTNATGARRWRLSANRRCNDSRAGVWRPPHWPASSPALRAWFGGSSGWAASSFSTAGAGTRPEKPRCCSTSSTGSTGAPGSCTPRPGSPSTWCFPSPTACCWRSCCSACFGEGCRSICCPWRGASADG